MLYLHKIQSLRSFLNGFAISSQLKGASGWSECLFGLSFSSLPSSWSCLVTHGFSSATVLGNGCLLGSWAMVFGLNGLEIWRIAITLPETLQTNDTYILFGLYFQYLTGTNDEIRLLRSFKDDEIMASIADVSKISDEQVLQKNCFDQKMWNSWFTCLNVGGDPSAIIFCFDPKNISF